MSEIAATNSISVFIPVFASPDEAPFAPTPLFICAPFAASCATTGGVTTGVVVSVFDAAAQIGIVLIVSLEMLN